jgi:predicted enzyme related to lactoylglutathione lyase
MPERTSYAPGTHCWVDIGTDLDAAKPFYTSLFGWSTMDAGPVEETGGYGFFMKGDKMVAGYGPQMNPGPPVWASYICTADADETAKKVEAAGGTVVVPAMDVMDAGRMAVFQDAVGGFFSVWQPGAHIGSQVANEPGAFSWNELNSRDVDGSIAFYESVFGWTHQTHKIDGPIGSYTEWQLDGQTIGGMLPMPPMVPAEVPTHWLVYFAVDDVDASLAKSQDLGATMILPPMQVDAGRFSIISDPQGAVLAIIQLAQ